MSGQTARDVMDSNPTVLATTDTIGTGIGYIMDNRFRNVPIVDAEGRYLVAGQDSPEDFARGVDTIMALVPETTRVYWVGYWLDDRLWGNVPWRENNAAIQAAVARYPNATYLDYAAFVERESLPHMKDGSHPTPEGMILRARWISEQLG